MHVLLIALALITLGCGSGPVDPEPSGYWVEISPLRADDDGPCSIQAIVNGIRMDFDRPKVRFPIYVDEICGEISGPALCRGIPEPATIALYDATSGNKLIEATSYVHPAAFCWRRDQ